MSQSHLSEPGAPGPVVIVGGGQAASEVAVQLRQSGFAGSVTILGDEPHLPYLRPPLSKAFLSGEIGAEALLIRAEAAYETARITVRTGVHVDRVDRHHRQLVLRGGEVVPYGTLVLATGGRPRMLKVPGADLGNIFYLRTIADVQALQSAFQPGKRLTIVGGGYIGLEVAAVAVKRGLKVTVLEGAPRVLARVTAPEMSAFYERMHRAEGVEIHTGIAVSGFVAAEGGAETGAVVGGVEAGEGGVIGAELVLVGIGLIPNIELAEEAGLIVDTGIVVDAAGRTADPHIHAVGDCAKHAHHGFLERPVRLESVPNALEQARAVACAITGRPLPAATAPWFWSDQYKAKLQMVGLSDGYDEVVMRGDPDGGSFLAFYLKDGRVIAADAVNRVPEFMVAKRLVGQNCAATAAQLANEAVPLKQLATATVAA